MVSPLVPRLRPAPIDVRKSTQSWATAFVRNHKDGRFEAEPGLGIPELLRDLGYVVTPIDAEVYELK